MGNSRRSLAPRPPAHLPPATSASQTSTRTLPKRQEPKGFRKKKNLKPRQGGSRTGARASEDVPPKKLKHLGRREAWGGDATRVVLEKKGYRFGQCRQAGFWLFGFLEPQTRLSGPRPRVWGNAGAANGPDGCRSRSVDLSVLLTRDDARGTGGFEERKSEKQKHRRARDGHEAWSRDKVTRDSHERQAPWFRRTCRLLLHCLLHSLRILCSAHCSFAHGDASSTDTHEAHSRSCIGIWMQVRCLKLGRVKTNREALS